MRRVRPQLKSLLHSPAPRAGLAALLAAGAVFALPRMQRPGAPLPLTGALPALVLFVLCAALFYRLPAMATRRRLCFTAPLGLAFSAMMVLGAALETSAVPRLLAAPDWGLSACALDRFTIYS